MFCIQFKLRANKVIRDLNSAFSPDQLPKFWLTATRLQCCIRKSRLRRSTLPRPVYESSFRTPKKVYETSRNRLEEQTDTDRLVS